MLVNAARAVGPAVAGVIIAAGGTGICFVLNAVSFVAVVVSLVRLDVAALSPATPTRAASARCATAWPTCRARRNSAVRC